MPRRNRPARGSAPLVRWCSKCLRLEHHYGAQPDPDWKCQHCRDKTAVSRG